MKFTPIAASILCSRLGLISLALVPMSALAASFDIDSRVTQVLVYPDQAWIQRQAQIDLPVGTHELYFRNLSSQSNMQSASFEAKGNASMQILNQGVESQDNQRYPNPRLSALQKELDEQEVRIAELRDELDVIDHQLELLRSMREGLATANQPLTMQEIEQMQSYSRTSYTQLHKERRDLSQRMKMAEDKLAEVKEDYDAYLAQQGQQSYAYRVTVHVDKAGQQTLDLSYYSWAASWVPSYQLQYDSQSHALALDYAAQLSQHTAEDWQDITIAFSTGRPMQVGVVPELDPQYIRFRPERPTLTRERSAMAPAPMAMNAAPAMVEMASDASVQSKAASRPQAQIQADAVASTFIIASKVTIPSGPQQQTVHISSSEQTVKPEYAYYPGFWADKVLMTVEGKNTLAYPLLPGALLSFADGKLVGSGELPMLLPGQSFKQMLGEDQRILAKAEPMKRFEENSGLINKTKVVRTEQSYSLSNQGQEVIALTVYGVIPKSQHEDIKVSVLDPKGVKLDEFGRYQQVLNLKPHDKQTFTQTYTVEYPIDKEVTGGY